MRNEFSKANNRWQHTLYEPDMVPNFAQLIQIFNIFLTLSLRGLMRLKNYFFLQVLIKIDYKCILIIGA